MWLWLTNMFSNPRRAVTTIVVVAVLLLALALSPATMGALAEILGLSGLLLIFRVPLRIVLPLCGGAILIAGAVSLVTEVLTMGVLPLIGAGIVVAGTVAVWMRTFRAPPRSRGAHWATLRDLRRAGFLGDHGCPLGSVDGHPVRLPMEREREGMLTMAATGSGKSTVVGIPAIMAQAKHPSRPSMVIVDPKGGELTRQTMSSLARTHRVLLWDPGAPSDCSVGFDPLASLPAPSDDAFVGEAKEVARSFFTATRGGDETSDRFWVNQAQALMEAIVLAFVVSRPKGTFVELADWTRQLKIEAFRGILAHSPHPSVRGYGGNARMR